MTAGDQHTLNLENSKSSSQFSALKQNQQEDEQKLCPRWSSLESIIQLIFSSEKSLADVENGDSFQSPFQQSLYFR